MISKLSKVKIYLKPGKTDMRKSINGLSIIVQDFCRKDAFCGDLFVRTEYSILSFKFTNIIRIKLPRPG